MFRTNKPENSKGSTARKAGIAAAGVGAALAGVLGYVYRRQIRAAAETTAGAIGSFAARQATRIAGANSAVVDAGMAPEWPGGAAPDAPDTHPAPPQSQSAPPEQP
jgi:hypothetical protein